MIELYKKLGRWVESDSYVPSPGDLVMYDWDDSGIGDNTGSPEHIGLVVSVSGKTLRIIEGNIKNAVGYRTLAVNGRYIRGYCAPNFASKATSCTAPAAPKVAAARSKDASAKNGVKYSVTASALNVRTSASAVSKANIIRTIPKGTVVVWYGYYTGSFYLVQLPDGTTGYVHKMYLRK